MSYVLAFLGLAFVTRALFKARDLGQLGRDAPRDRETLNRFAIKAPPHEDGSHLPEQDYLP